MSMLVNIIVESMTTDMRDRKDAFQKAWDPTRLFFVAMQSINLPTLNGH